MVSDILFGAVMGIGQSLSAKRDFERQIFAQDREKADRMEQLREQYRLDGENALAVERARQDTERMKQEAEKEMEGTQMVNAISALLPGESTEVVQQIATHYGAAGFTPGQIVMSPNARLMTIQYAKKLNGAPSEVSPPYGDSMGSMGDVAPTLEAPVGVRRIESVGEDAQQQPGFVEFTRINPETGAAYQVRLGKGGSALYDKLLAEVVKELPDRNKAGPITISNLTKTLGIEYTAVENALSLTDVSSQIDKAQTIIRNALDAKIPLKKAVQESTGREFFYRDDTALTPAKLGEWASAALATEVAFSALPKLPPEVAATARKNLVRNLATLGLDLRNGDPREIVANPLFRHLDKEHRDQLEKLYGFANPSIKGELGDRVTPGVAFGASQADSIVRGERVAIAKKEIQNLPYLFNAKETSRFPQAKKGAQQKYAQLILDMVRNDQLPSVLNTASSDPAAFGFNQNLPLVRETLMDAAIQMEKVPVFLADWETTGRSVDELEGVSYEEYAGTNPKFKGAMGWRVYMNGKPQFFPDKNAESVQ